MSDIQRFVTIEDGGMAPHSDGDWVMWKDVASRVLAMSKELERLRAENERLRKENAELKEAFVEGDIIIEEYPHEKRGE